MKSIVRWTLVYTLIFVAWLAVIHLAGIYTANVRYAVFVDTAAIVMPIIVLWLAFRSDRVQRGRFSFKHALPIGIGIGLLTAPISFGVMWLYHHYVNPEWLAFLVQHKRATLAGSDLTQAQVESQISSLVAGGADGAQLVGALVGNPIMFTVLSLAIASIMAIHQRWRGAAG